MNAIHQKILALLLGLIIALPAVRADDIDIYNNPADNPLKPPMTILVLDLNLLGICNNVLTRELNPANPDAPQLCLDIRNSQLLEDLLAGTTDDPQGLLTGLLTGSGMDANGLCNLYGILGLVSPAIPIQGVSVLLRPLLGGVTQLSCSTLGFLTSIPLLSGVINGLLGGFVEDLIEGLVDPLLTTVVGQLPTAVTGLLNTTFSGILNLGQTSLVSLLESMLNNLINSRVAIMVNHADRSSAAGDTGAACAFGDQASIPTSRRETVNCSNGAYFLVGFTPLVDQGAITQVVTRVVSALTDALDPVNLLNSTTALLSSAVTNPAELLPPYQGKEVYVEIAHYLSGDVVYNAPLSRWDGLTGLLTRDQSIENGANYIQPDAQCDTVNVLNVQLTNTGRDDESDDELRRYFPAAEVAGGFTFPDVVAQAAEPGFVDLLGNEIRLNSHFLLQDNLTSAAALASTGANVTAYANNLGLLGLGQTVAELLKPVLEVDASLLTPSITADTLSPGQLRPEAFFGSFLPAAEKSPRWSGNLKKLELRADDDGNFLYFDARSANAIASDGRIREDALSFWTLPALLGSAAGDGRAAELGGAGQRIPGYQRNGGGEPGRSNADGARQLFYDHFNATAIPSLAALDADDADVRSELQSALGASSDTHAHELLLYARGYEVGPTLSSLGTGNDLVGREWLHGAVLHSRPVAINYGARGSYSESNPDIRLLYGASDGYLRMLRNTSSGGAESGAEVWGFMPRVVMNQQKALRDNDSASVFPYGVDGAPTVVIRDRDSSGGVADGVIDHNNTHDQVRAYFGLRRGGSHVYALDITNPDAPEMLWRIGPDGLFNSSGQIAGSASHFAEMALSFSNPQAGRIRYEQSGNTSVSSAVVFGAGYNGGRTVANVRLGKDLARGSDGVLGLDDGKGNAIYLVDALTGELIWKAAKGTFNSTTPYNAASKTFLHPLMTDSFAADTTAVDTDGDGSIDRLYALDTGGRLWRADFPGSDRSKWTITPLASVGRHDTANVSNDRRFFQAPDYVPYRDSNGAYDAIVFGSGDRADPFNAATQNHLFVYRDRDVATGKTVAQINTSESDLDTLSDFVDLTAACADGAAGCGTSADNAIGWRLALTGRGEKIMSQPLTTGGVIFVTSYVMPDPNSRTCAPEEGSNRLYGVSLADSRPVINDFIDDSDGDKRSTDGGSPGLAGEVNSLASNSIAANTMTLEARSPRYYPVYWRERRGDDETRPQASTP